MLSITSSLKTNSSIKDEWTTAGQNKLDEEQVNKHAVILKFEQEPSAEIRKIVRNHCLRRNKLRIEWYGYCNNVDSLKNNLGSAIYTIEEL